MATLNLGRIKPVFRGAWTSGAFVIDDIVTHGNESFICIQAGTNKATSDASYWTKLAAKGTDGTDGTDVGTTITTQGDILFRDGSGLQRLAKGTASQVLAMNGAANAPEWVAASGGTVLKVYQKSFVGGHTIAGASSSWRAVSHYVTPTITPISSSSKFLIQWTISGYANDDHHFFKVRRDIGGTVTDVGLSGSALGNHADWGETGSLVYGRHTNMTPIKTIQIADAPATGSGVFWQLYNQAHSQTFYFGRSAHNTTSKQYATQNTVTIWELDGSKATFSQETSY